jgi:hypothetical protein
MHEISWLGNFRLLRKEKEMFNKISQSQIFNETPPSDPPIPPVTEPIPPTVPTPIPPTVPVPEPPTVPAPIPPTGPQPI